MTVKYCRIKDGERVGCGKGKLENVLLARREGQTLRIHAEGEDSEGVEFTGSEDTWPGPIEIEFPVVDDYAHRRRNAYPPLRDQLDMLYEDMKDGGSRFVDAIDAVKAAHPKPGA